MSDVSRDAHERDLEVALDELRNIQDVVLEALDVAAVAKAVGVRKPGVYTRWKGKAGLAAAIAERATDPLVFDSMKNVPPLLERVLQSEAPLEALNDFLPKNFAVVKADAMFAIQLMLLAGDPSDEISGRLATMYERFDDDTVTLLTRALDRWGREALPDVGVESLATMINCIIEGTAMRARVDPLVEASHYTWTVFAYLILFTRPRGASTSLEEVLAPIQSFGAA
jgi:AcrR family transcriptional regulator